MEVRSSEGWKLPSRRELFGGTVFFGVLALLLAGLLRPLDGSEWIALAICLGFVAVGSFAVLRYDALVERRVAAFPVARSRAVKAAPVEDEPAGSAEHEMREPSEDERQLLRTTIDAFEEAGALVPGEVDVETLWRATQHFDPGPVVNVYTALSAFSWVAELGRPKFRRLTFVPVGTEYDAALIAGLTTEILISLGHEVDQADVSVDLPGGSSEGASVVEFPIDGRRKRVPFHYRWKLHPPELFEALAGFTREDDPRELVCADPDYQQLLYAAVRPGTLARLNLRFPIDDLFGDP